MNNKTTIFSCLIQGFKRKFLPGKSQQNKMTGEELRNVLLEGEKSGLVESEERTMVEGVFYLGDRPVRAFMSHRSEILWLDMKADANEARLAIGDPKEQDFFPVTSSGDLDEIKGVVSARDIIKLLLNDTWSGLESIIKAPYFIPETMSALKAFEAFKQTNAMDLFVMDEYGGFAGVLTVQNLIEEIVGELSPPSAAEEKEIIKKEDGTWLIDGGVNIDDVALALELEGLSDEQNEYHTLAGFILYIAGEIPALGTQYIYKDYRFTIMEIDGNRIDKIMASKLQS